MVYGFHRIYIFFGIFNDPHRALWTPAAAAGPCICRVPDSRVLCSVLYCVYTVCAGIIAVF